MSPEILTILSVFSILLLFSSIAMSIFLLYDIKSGNYRKFLSASKDHGQLADKVQDVRARNLGEEA